MREWLISLAAGDVLALITLASVVAVLHRDEQRATRARKVLRMLLVFTTGAGIAAAVKLHQAGLL
jgi:hypothetical protein